MEIVRRKTSKWRRKPPLFQTVAAIAQHPVPDLIEIGDGRMRMKLSLADTVALLLGLFGYYAVATIMVVKCECGGSDYAMAAGLFSVSSVFLLPAIHRRLTALTHRWTVRAPFLALSMVWVFLSYSTLNRFSGMDLPLPGWSILSEHSLVVWGVIMGLIVFNYVIPGAAYSHNHSTSVEGDIASAEVVTQTDATV